MKMIGEYLPLLVLGLASIQISVVPMLIFWMLHSMRNRLSLIEADVADIADVVLGSPDDDDPEQEDEPQTEPSNIVAIGRRAA